MTNIRYDQLLVGFHDMAILYLFPRHGPDMLVNCRLKDPLFYLGALIKIFCALVLGQNHRPSNRNVVVFLKLVLQIGLLACVDVCGKKLLQRSSLVEKVFGCQVENV